MKWTREVKRKTSAADIVLVISSVSVCWFRCENSLVTERLKHAVHDDPKPIIDSCEWLRQLIENPDAHIQLIMETELDDLDRVKLIDSTHRITRSWHIRKVLWQLRREYRDATVYPLPNYLYPEVASVLYSQLANEMSIFLNKLCDCGVVITHSVSSSQLLLDTFRHCTKPVLLYMFDGRNRHRLLLSDGGLPLHMRQAVSPSAEKGGAEAVELCQSKSEYQSEDSRKLNVSFAETYISESITQLAGTVFSSLNEVTLIVTGDLGACSTSQYSDEFLVKCLLGLPCEVSYENITITEEVQKSESLIIRLEKINTGLLSDFRAPKTLLGSCLPIKNFLPTQTLNNYQLTRAPEKIRQLLQQSLVVVNQRRRARLLTRSTVFVFLLFLIVVVISSMKGVHGLRQRESFDTDNEKIKANYHTLQKHAKSLHESPSFVSDSLLRIQQFDKAPIYTPAQVIRSVANVVQDFPSVSLTAFAWAVSDLQADSEFININAVSVRDNYWGGDAAQMKTTVEMSGQLVSEESLRQKQSELNRFLRVLAESDKMMDLRIIDSPATSAKSSDLLSESGGFFKIQFSLKPK